MFDAVVDFDAAMRATRLARIALRQTPTTACTPAAGWPRGGWTPSRWTPCWRLPLGKVKATMIKRLTLPRACLRAAPPRPSASPFVQFQPAKDAVSLTGGIAVDAADEPAVPRWATRPPDPNASPASAPQCSKLPRPRARTLILVGIAAGKSALIDALVAAGKPDLSLLKGYREGWQIAAVVQPLLGVERALVIVGSDRRHGHGDRELSGADWRLAPDPVGGRAQTQRTALYVPAGIARAGRACVVATPAHLLERRGPRWTG